MVLGIPLKIIPKMNGYDSPRLGNKNAKTIRAEKHRIKLAIYRAQETILNRPATSIKHRLNKIICITFPPKFKPTIDIKAIADRNVIVFASIIDI